MHKIALLASVATSAFMSQHPETVKIRRGNDIVIINKDDYDEERDGELVNENADDAPPSPALSLQPAPGIVVPPAPSAPRFVDPVAPGTVTEDTLSVAKEGRKFFVVKASDGSRVEGFRDIDEAGYKTEGEAWAAVMAVKKQPHEQQIEPPANFPTAAEIEAKAKEAEG